ncbi:acyl-CoA thioesterase II [Aspergillus avenaceus]|uniref:Acyl-CoA thioesterase II n=1 Tax=Aspergillus avenaceus TaxID=36643 RepID=A0A5N6U9Q5_ASPAV|nr:acyl-CoA thioesterase II [Aspergillus avenaceus]
MSPVSDALAVKPAFEDRNDIFTNVNPLWRPDGMKAVFGGALMSQALNAALQTVGPSWSVQSMHCQFTSAANIDSPVFYHVHGMDSKKTFLVCNVSARQQERLIITATLRFTRSSYSVGTGLQHATPKPKIYLGPDPKHYRSGEGTAKGLCEFKTAPDPSCDPQSPAGNRFRRLVRLRSRIPHPAGTRDHVVALAAVTDTYCLGTPGRAHGLSLLRPSEASGEAEAQWKVRQMGTLSHSIHFLNPQAVCLNEWMLEETWCPWAGDERGLVMLHLWSQDGVLLAVCTQEVCDPLPST